MLGLGSSLLQGGALRSIVKSSLKLFYKADRTQAPLGEEQVRNNSFDELGPDKIDNGNFEAGIDGWNQHVNGDSTVTYNSLLKGIKLKKGASGTVCKTSNSASNTVQGKTYKLTYRVLENNNCTAITVWNGGGYEGSTVLNVEANGEDFVYYLKFIGGDSLDLYFENNTDNSDITLSNIRLEQLDPNNRWSFGDGYSVEEGKAVCNGTQTGNTSLKQFLSVSNLVAGKTYKLSYTISNYVNGLVNPHIRGAFIGNVSGNGDKVAYIVAGPSTGYAINFFADSNFNAEISNVSIKEITNSIKDHSRNSNDGILYSGKALDFDGTGDIVELNDANLPGEFTVCTWVKPDTFTHCVVFGDGRDENNVYLNLNWIRLNSPTSITVKINGTSTHYVDLIHGGNIAQDEWSRLIVTRDSDNVVKFGINGVFYSPRNQARAGNFNFNLLGRKQDTEMNGALADVQVYDKAWTASDVEFDYNNPDKDVFDNPNSSIVVTDCKSLLRLNEGAGDRVYDAAPVLRAEEVQNGTFELGEELNDLTWVNNSGWFINGDTASSNSDGSTLTNTILEIGKTYQFKCKLSSYTSGNFRLMLGGSTISSNFSGTDEFTFTGVCTGDRNARVQSLSGIGSLSISSLTIKEVPNWTPGDGWSFEDGGAIQSGGVGQLHQTGVLTAGESYSVSVTIDSIASGTSLKVALGSGGPELLFSNIGTTTLIGTAASNEILYLLGNESGFLGSISNISVKEIKPAESFAIVGTKAFIHQQPHIPQYAMSSFSKKMLFDGVNDYVTGSFNGNIGPAKDITFSCWFSYEDSVAAQGDRETLFGLLSSSGDGLPFNKFEVSLFETNKITVFTGDGSTHSTSNSNQNSLVKNKLNHVAVSISSAGQVKIYINGTLDTTGSVTNFGAATVTHYRIGSRSNSTQLNKGIIDEVSLFKSELTQGEVLELYNSGSSFNTTGHSKYNLGEEVSNGTLDLGSEEVVNGDFATDSDWTKRNVSTINGVANVIANGNIASSSANWSLESITNVFEPSKTYQIKFKAKQVSLAGSNAGAFQVGNSFGALFNEVITSEFVDYTFTAQASSNNWPKLTIGGQAAGDVFQIDNISVKEIPSWSFGDGWSYVDGKASLVQVGSPQNTDHFKQELTGLVDGRTYVVGFDLDITSATVTTIGLSSSGAFGNLSSSVRFHETSGRKTFTAIYDSSHQSGIKELRFVGGSSTEFTIDNVSVQEYGVSGYWRNNGADQWDDLSINSNHGTVSGSPTEIFLQEVPSFGKDSLGMFMNKPRLGGLNFAKNGWVEVRDNASLDVASTNAISVCCWYRANSAASYDAAQYLVNSETYSNAGGWTLIAGTTQIVWTAEVGSNASIGYNHNDRLGWQYIVATYDEQNYRLFTFDENGDISVTTPVASTSALVDEYPINIGGFNEGSGSLINGVIDDIKIYNKALTQAEIKKNFNATKGKHKN